MMQTVRWSLSFLFAVALPLAACSQDLALGRGSSPPPLAPAQAGTLDKWSLWSSGTKLRGANIYQRRVYPDLDGDSMGPGPIGPPYIQADFDNLAALGANYVNISHPGLFAENPPYVLDQGVSDNLDNLISMAQSAHLFVVISFRTGPGRSEFTFFHGQDWFPASYYNDQVWKDAAAQDGWVAMWRATADRYKGNPVVVGYDLMVEPNSNDVWLNIWDPTEFYPLYANTLYDWNPLQAKISQAIREVDTDTPILTGSMSYSSVLWLPYLVPTGDSKTVYTFHFYEPYVYTNQDPPLLLSYPGTFDANGDGVPETVNRAWLDQYLDTADAFAAQHGVTVGSNEFGSKRWEPGAAAYMTDMTSLLEQRGINRALWLWSGSWAPRAADDDWNFTHGPDPSNHQAVATSDLIQAIKADWSKNVDRPDCALTCNASAPDHARPGAPVAFSATVNVASQCTGSPEIAWDFGDGSPPSSEQNPSHTYANPGSFTWSFQATLSAASCQGSGTIVVTSTPPPAIASITKTGSSFALRIQGSGFQAGAQVFIGGDTSPWANAAFKSASLFLLKGGGSLKAKFPKGVSTPVKLVNPDGQQTTGAFTR